MNIKYLGEEGLSALIRKVKQSITESSKPLIIDELSKFKFDSIEGSENTSYAIITEEEYNPIIDKIERAYNESKRLLIQSENDGKAFEAQVEAFIKKDDNNKDVLSFYLTVQSNNVSRAYYFEPYSQSGTNLGKPNNTFCVIIIDYPTLDHNEILNDVKTLNEPIVLIEDDFNSNSTYQYQSAELGYIYAISDEYYNTLIKTLNKAIDESRKVFIKSFDNTLYEVQINVINEKVQEEPLLSLTDNFNTNTELVYNLSFIYTTPYGTYKFYYSIHSKSFLPYQDIIAAADEDFNIYSCYISLIYEEIATLKDGKGFSTNDYTDEDKDNLTIILPQILSELTRIVDVNKINSFTAVNSTNSFSITLNNVSHTVETTPNEPIKINITEPTT